MVTTERGHTRRLYANWLHNNALDRFLGWKCSAGQTRFYIDSKFDVYSGECKNDHLGNALTNWQTKNDTICCRQTCTGCTDDLITAKYRLE